MRLALATGRRLAELEEMGVNELREWMAYAELEPWGEERMDWRFASLTAVVINRFRSKDEPMIHPKEMVPDFSGERAERAEPTPEEAREMARQLFQALSGAEAK